MTRQCTAAVKRDGELRQCKRRSTHDGFCAEHALVHSDEDRRIVVWDWPGWAVRLWSAAFAVCGRPV